MGVTVTFSAILELLREGLIEIVQSEPFAPITCGRRAAQRFTGRGQRAPRRQPDRIMSEQHLSNVLERVLSRPAGR